MTDEVDSDEMSLPLPALERIEGVCLQFEAAWKKGERPRIEDYLGDKQGAERSDLLRELLALDLDYRRKAGDQRMRDDPELMSIAETLQKLEELISARVLLQTRVRGMAAADQHDREKTIADVRDLLAQKAPIGLDDDDLSLAMSAAKNLEKSGREAMAADAYEAFHRPIEGADGAIHYGQLFEGSARRLRLLGKGMVLTGKLLDGRRFDWDAYRGRVVLVYFWSTSHEPCVPELRRIKKCYELYHDRGFDVVGISLDRSTWEVNNFLKKERLPWPTLFDQYMPTLPTLSEQHNGGPRSMATYCGVTEIPTAFLVDKDGKVVSLRAQGAELGRLLKERLGPVGKKSPRAPEKSMPDQPRPPMYEPPMPSLPRAPEKSMREQAGNSAAKPISLCAGHESCLTRRSNDPPAVKQRPKRHA